MGPDHIAFDEICSNLCKGWCLLEGFNRKFLLLFHFFLSESLFRWETFDQCHHFGWSVVDKISKWRRSLRIYRIFSISIILITLHLLLCYIFQTRLKLDKDRHDSNYHCYIWTIVTMSLIAANKRRLSITFNRSPTRPIPIFSELNRDHQSRTAGRRRKRSFPFVPSTMPLYCIPSLSSTARQRRRNMERDKERKRKRKRERALHRIKSRPQATRLRIAGLDSLPTRVHRTESWLLKSGSREKFNPNRPGRVRTVSNKQKCFEDDNRRGLEIGFDGRRLDPRQCGTRF